MDIAAARTAEGKLHLFAAIDRTSKFAFVQLLDRADMAAASGFLEALIEAVPYRIHTVLTDNGIQFADLPKNGLRGHPFDRLCWCHGIEHRLTKPSHPWTDGQVERMNSTIKNATVSRCHCETHAQIRKHLDEFILAYTFARRLKTLKGLTPCEFLYKTFLAEPERLDLTPSTKCQNLTPN